METVSDLDVVVPDPSSSVELDIHVPDPCSDLKFNPNMEKVQFLNDLCLGVSKRFESSQPLTDAIENYLDVLQKLLEKKLFRKTKARVWGKYTKLQNISPEVLQFIVGVIDDYTAKLSANPVTRWSSTLALMTFMEDPYKERPEMQNKANSSGEPIAGPSSAGPSSAGPSSRPSVGSKSTAAGTSKVAACVDEEAKAKKVNILERNLNLLGKKIKEVDESDENWDDEYNSPYLIKTRLVAKYMETWKKLCCLTDSISGTGRPVQKVVHIEKVTRYPEIDQEAEKFLNSTRKGVLFFPDYQNILKLVNDANKKHKLYIADVDSGDIARELFQHIVKTLKRRRARDLEMGLDFGLGETSDDPADHDAELAKKLEENIAKRRTEAEVLRKFTQDQEQMNAVAEEVLDNDPDASAPEDDDEEEEDDDVEVAEEYTDSTIAANVVSTSTVGSHVVDLEDNEVECIGNGEASEEPPAKQLRLTNGKRTNGKRVRK